MEKKTAMIVSGDETYATKLSSVINDDERFPFFLVPRVLSDDELSTLTSKKKRSGIAPGKKGTEELAELLLVDAETVPDVRVISDFFGVSEGKAVIRISAEKPKTKKSGMSVYKYQSADDLKNALREYFPDGLSSEINLQESRIGTTVFCGFTSPFGRIDSAGFLKKCEDDFGITGRTLYVTFSMWNDERFFGNGDMMNAEPETGNMKTLSDFLYERTKFSEEEKPFSEYVVHCGDKDVLLPVDSPEDIYLSNPERIKQLLKGAVEGNGYETVIINLGTDPRYTETFLPILSKLYVPECPSREFRNCAENYMKWLQRISPKKNSFEIQRIRVAM